MKGATLVAVMMWGAAVMAAEPDAESVVVADGERPTWAGSLSPVVEVETFGGQKHLSRGSFRALDEQVEAGVRATVARRQDDVLRFTVGYLESRASRKDDGFEIGAITREAGAGLVARIEGRRAEATASAGVALLETQLAAAYALRTWESKERGLGLWYAVGVRIPVGTRVTAGIEMRQTIGGVYGRNHSSRANGFHVGGTLGFRVGKAGGRS